MAKTPETLFDLVPQDVRIVRRGTHDIAFRALIEEFKLPKELVFRERSSFLTLAEQDIIEGVINGESNKQIALNRRMSLQTVKNQITTIGNRLREEGYEITSSTGEVRLNIVLTLLRMEELELRDSIS